MAIVRDKGSYPTGELWENLRLECDCGNGERVVLSFDENEGYPDYLEVILVPARLGFFGRIKAAFKTLVAKDPVYGEVILDEESVGKMSEFFHNHYTKVWVEQVKQAIASVEDSEPTED